LNCLIYAQLQIVLLNGQEHKRNNATGELCGSLFNKFGTLLAGLVHFCGTRISVVYTRWLIEFLTLQTYNRCRFHKLGQILLFENPFHLGVEALWVSTSVDALILQPENRIAPELVIFSEHRYHRN
jgi:hypothetical protein